MTVSERISSKQSQITQINRRLSARGLDATDRAAMMLSLASLHRQIAMLSEANRTPSARPEQQRRFA